MDQTTSIEHFWVGANPYFNPYLIVCPDSSMIPSEVSLDFFDVDGELFNSARVTIASDKVQCVALEPFLSGCKVESGVKHCHVRATTPSSETRLFCRLHSQASTNVTSHAQLLNENVPGFFPITLEEGSSNLVALMNTSDQETTLKLRLYAGNRSPELLFTLAPHATKLLHVESLFEEVATIAQGKTTQGYLRLFSKSSASVGVQILTKELSTKEQPVFSALV